MARLEPEYLKYHPVHEDEVPDASKSTHVTAQGSRTNACGKPRAGMAFIGRVAEADLPSIENLCGNCAKALPMPPAGEE